jgi:hypothetical protein
MEVFTSVTFGFVSGFGFFGFIVFDFFIEG